MNSKELAIEYCNKAKEYAEKAVDYAIKCGEELIKVKAELPHGEFILWIEANMPIKRNQCQKYMTLARNKELLETQINPQGLIWDITSAIEYINSLKENDSNESSRIHLEDKKAMEKNVEAAKIANEEIKQNLESTHNIKAEAITETQLEKLKSKQQLKPDVFTESGEYDLKSDHCTYHLRQVIPALEELESIFLTMAVTDNTDLTEEEYDKIVDLVERCSEYINNMVKRKLK